MFVIKKMYAWHFLCLTKYVCICLCTATHGIFKRDKTESMKNCYCLDNTIPGLLVFCNCTSLTDTDWYSQSLLILQDKVKKKLVGIRDYFCMNYAWQYTIYLARETIGSLKQLYSI